MNQNSYVYHSTSRQLLPVIAKEGLVPQPPDAEGWPEFEEDDWGCCDYGDDDDDDEAEDDPAAYEPRLFAFESLAEAQGFIKSRSDAQECVVLRMPQSAAEWTDGATDYVYLYTEETVPAALIQYLDKDGSWKPIDI